MNTAIILSAGSSERSGLKFNKNLFVFDGKTVIEHTIAPFLKVKSIGEIIVAVKKAEIAKFEKLILPLSKKIKLCVGGDTRTQSVKNALCLATGKYVFIHDGARPFVSEKLIKKCAYMAVNKGNCVPTFRDTIPFQCQASRRCRRWSCRISWRTCRRRLCACCP